ncbi:hypothetical protein [Actinokineospora pegani]|uniref:hypothetical protein n=1 Tax=Actinokineospora pegani TaxID=2654637 RepID=UPI0012EA2C60|nr:hypothetical protein [Actinokineospora pegani]
MNPPDVVGADHPLAVVDPGPSHPDGGATGVRPSVRPVVRGSLVVRGSSAGGASAGLASGAPYSVGMLVVL